MTDTESSKHKFELDVFDAIHILKMVTFCGGIAPFEPMFTPVC
jgi:hypothetical protein